MEMENPMPNCTSYVSPIIIALTILTLPIAVKADSHVAELRPVMLADVDPYVHRSNFLVADLERTFRVYRDILGFKVDAVAGPITSFMHDVLNIPAEAETRIAFLSSVPGKFGNMGFTEVKGVDLPQPTGLYPSVLIIEVQRDLETLRDQLIEAGCQIKKIYRLSNPSRNELLFTDNDGHRVILMQLDPPE